MTNSRLFAAATRIRQARFGAAISLILGLVAAAPGTHPVSLATGSMAPYSYSGGAYGTFAYVDNEQGLVRSGRTAVSGLDCVTEPGVTQQNNVAAVNASPHFRTGLVETQSQSLSLPAGPAARTMATINDVVMLGGLITADVIKAMSTSGTDGIVFYGNADGSSFENLRINGLPVANVPPNTKIDLPGIGSVVLNEQILAAGTSARMVVNMIHVVVRQDNVLLIPWGTNIIVGHAESGIRASAGQLEGAAYGSKVFGSVVMLGESALSFMPCNGTDGETLQIEMGTIQYKNVLAFDGVKSTARGTVDATSAQGEMTARITGVDVLAGRITADAIVAHASVNSSNGNVSVNDAGSTLLNLRVDGVSISANAAQDTRMDIANVGTLWIHRVVRTGTSIEVRMLELVVEVPNAYDLPIGTRIQVSVARAGVR